MDNIKELNDEELSKVTGGLKAKIEELNVNDVFFEAGSNKNGLVVLNNVEVVSETTQVPVKFFFVSSTGELSYSPQMFVTVKELSYYNYSSEYSNRTILKF